MHATSGISDSVAYSVPDLVEIDRVPWVPDRVAPGIRQPRSDLATLAYERALGNDTRFSASAVYRVDRNFVDRVLPDVRWEAVTATNPLTGKPITWYRRGPLSGATIANVDGFAYLDPEGQVLGRLDAHRSYAGLMLVLARRLSRRWQAQASFVASHARGTFDNDFDGSGDRSFSRNPNEALVNADGSLSFDPRHELKLLVSYEVPRVDVTLSCNLSSVGGTRWAPIGVFQFREVRLEPRGSRAGDTVTLLDLRLEKVFHPLAGKHRVGVYADVSNLFDAGPVLAVQAFVPSKAFVGAPNPIAFGAPLAIAPARQVILGARWSF